MIALARFDPLPLSALQFALPEPAAGLQMIHGVIHRIDRPAPVPRAGGDQHDRFAGMHQAGAVDNDDPHQPESRLCRMGQRLQLQIEVPDALKPRRIAIAGQTGPLVEAQTVN